VSFPDGGRDEAEAAGRYQPNLTLTPDDFEMLVVAEKAEG